MYGYIEVVRFLIENRAQMDVENKNGDTALILAVRHGHTEVVKILRENGVHATHPFWQMSWISLFLGENAVLGIPIA